MELAEHDMRPATRASSLDANVQRWFIFLSVAFTPVFLVGLFLVRAVPPRSPDVSADTVARLYSEHQVAVEVGAAILMAGCILYGVFSAVRILWMRRLEAGRMPVLTTFSAFLAAMDCVGTMLSFSLYAVVAYRAGTAPADTTQALLDLTTFILIYPVSPMIATMVVFALAIHWDRSSPKIFPPWLGQISIATAVLSVGAGAIGFTKVGPFASNGLLGFWLVMAAFGVWQVSVALCLLRAISTDERRRVAEAG